MKGTGRQSVLKPLHKLETITHGHRTAQIGPALSAELAAKANRSASGHHRSPYRPRPPLDVALVVSARTHFAAHLFFAPAPNLVMIPTRIPRTTGLPAAAYGPASRFCFDR